MNVKANCAYALRARWPLAPGSKPPPSVTYLAERKGKNVGALAPPEGLMTLLLKRDEGSEASESEPGLDVASSSSPEVYSAFNLTLDMALGPSGAVKPVPDVESYSG